MEYINRRYEFKVVESTILIGCSYTDIFDHVNNIYLSETNFFNDGQRGNLIPMTDQLNNEEELYIRELNTFINE